MQVALATPEDVPQLCGLLDILFAQEAEFSPDPAKQRDGLKAIMADSSIGLILVLRDGTEIVGMVNLLFTISTYLGAKVALLEDMIVHPAHRERGAGTLLLEAARQHAVEQGCRRITLLTDGSNSAARAFYQARGFTPSSMMPYRLTLP